MIVSFFNTNFWVCFQVWEIITGGDDIQTESWPLVDPQALVLDQYEVQVQVYILL